MFVAVGPGSGSRPLALLTTLAGPSWEFLLAYSAVGWSYGHAAVILLWDQFLHTLHPAQEREEQ